MYAPRVVLVAVSPNAYGVGGIGGVGFTTPVSAALIDYSPVAYAIASPIDGFTILVVYDNSTVSGTYILVTSVATSQTIRYELAETPEHSYYRAPYGNDSLNFEDYWPLPDYQSSRFPCIIRVTSPAQSQTTGGSNDPLFPGIPPFLNFGTGVNQTPFIFEDTAGPVDTYPVSTSSSGYVQGIVYPNFPVTGYDPDDCIYNVYFPNSIPVSSLLRIAYHKNGDVIFFYVTGALLHTQVYDRDWWKATTWCGGLLKKHHAW